MDPDERREDVLIFPGQSSDAQRLIALLTSAGIASSVRPSLEDTLAALPRAHAAVLFEAEITPDRIAAISQWIENQPDRSRFPFLLVPAPKPALDETRLGHVLLLPADLEPRAVLAATRSALATRREQHLCRRQIAALADASDRLESSARRQSLLVRELHHRVKNTLATIQALMGSTARSSDSVEEFRQALLGRIAALSHVHEILTEDKWQEASLRALFQAELHDVDASVDLEGPDIKIPSHLAVPLGMAVHELTANALRYGSLSEVGGTVRICWTVDASRNRNILRIDWLEANGPPLPIPRRRGFGTQLLERVLRQQAAADVDIHYKPEGLNVVMHIPLPERTHFHLFAEA